MNESAATDDGHEKTTRTVRVLLWLMQPRIGIPLLIVLVVLLGPFVNRARKLSSVPDAPPPFDVAAFKADLVPDDQNAALKMIAATKLMVSIPSSETENLSATLEQGWSVASPALRKCVQDNQPAIAVWREAARLPDSQYIKPGEMRLTTPLPMIQASRDLMRICTLEAGRLREERRLTDAAELLLDGLRISELLGRRGSLIEYLVSAACVMQTRKGLLALAADEAATAELLQHTLAEVRKICPGDPSISHSIKVEYLWVHDLATKESLSVLGPGLGGGGFADQLVPLLYFQGEPLITARAAGHVHTRMLEQIEKRRCERTPRSGSHSIYDPDSSGKGSKWSGTEISRFIDETHFGPSLMGSMTHIVDAHDRNIVEHDLLAAGLALEWFRRVRGTYPERLEELVPDYLPKVPDDALAASRVPLGYRRNHDSATLWSVWKNGVDDGGSLSSPTSDRDLDWGIILKSGMSKEGTQAGANE